jgi:hypothetical protein
MIDIFRLLVWFRVNPMRSICRKNHHIWSIWGVLIVMRKATLSGCRGMPGLGLEPLAISRSSSALVVSIIALICLPEKAFGHRCREDTVKQRL